MTNDVFYITLAAAGDVKYNTSVTNPSFLTYQTLN
jgi:hypothetical protein